MKQEDATMAKSRIWGVIIALSGLAAVVPIVSKYGFTSEVMQVMVIGIGSGILVLAILLYCIKKGIIKQ